MVGHVEHLDQLAFDVKHSGNPDARAEAAGDSFGNAGLAVAGEPIKEKAAARVDGRAEHVESPLGDQQIGKGSPQILLLGVLGRNRLGRDRIQVVLERHGSRSHISAFVQVDLGPGTASVRQRVNEVAGRGRACVVDDLLVLELPQKLRERAKGQAELGSDPPARGSAQVQEKLEDQALDHRMAQARFLKRVDHPGMERRAAIRILETQERWKHRGG